MDTKRPIIDVFASCPDDDSKDVRFTFGERKGLIGVEVNGDEMVFVPMETIRDLWVVYNGMDWGQQPKQPSLFDEAW